MKTLFQSIALYLALTILTGILYPLAMTGFARVMFLSQAEGSRIMSGEKLVGSDLLAQKFENPKYFWPRPSASDFATVPSGASNKGPTSADLKKSIDEWRTKFGADAPIDLLTTSGSGLDPHISPEAARVQSTRVAEGRNIPTEKISSLIEDAIEPPQFGFLGEPRINVFRLNRSLDNLH